MRLICKYSGVEYFSDYFADERMVDCHPIFRETQRNLLAKARKWGQGKFGVIEEKLLFLSLLNSTGAIDFQTYGDPSPSVVSTNMESLFKLVAWHEHVNPGTFKLPKFRVSEHTYTLTNVNIWIASWYECRKEWQKGGERKALQDALEAREFAIGKMLHSGKSLEEMAGRLGSWAITAAEVPGYTRDYWLELFKLKDDQVYDQEHLEPLQSCLQWMEDKLFAIGSYGAGAGNTYAVLTIQHLTKLVQRCEGGQLADLLGDEARSFSFLSSETESETEAEAEGGTGDGSKKYVSTISTLSGTREEVGWKLMALQAPATEPKREDYPSLGSFIKAKANFAAAKMIAEAREAREMKAGSGSGSGSGSGNKIGLKDL